MGMVHAEITIKNALDVGMVHQGLIQENAIRSFTVNAVVDTGAASIVINDEQCQMLGLRVTAEKKVKTADGRWVPCWMTDPVEVHWKDRSWSCPAIVVGGATSVLLGAIPLEGMDLIVNPKTQELIGAHGDTVELMLLFTQLSSCTPLSPTQAL